MEMQVWVRGLLGILAYYLTGGGKEKEQRLGCRKKPKPSRFL